MESSFGPNNFVFKHQQEPRKFYCSKGHQWERADGVADTVSFCLDGKNLGPPICMWCIAIFAEENFGIVSEIKPELEQTYDLVNSTP